MDSISPEINAMHAAFCEARGLDLPLNGCTERQWDNAIKMGMTPADVTLLIKARKERIKAGIRHEECLYMRNITGSEDVIANALEEIAAVKAKQRVKVYPAGKSEVLRATGRPDQPEQGKTMPFSEVIKGLRKAAE